MTLINDATASPKPTAVSPSVPAQAASADTGISGTGTTSALPASGAGPNAVPQTTDITDTLLANASIDVNVDTYAPAPEEDTADPADESEDVDVIVPTAPLSVVPEADVLLSAANRFGTTWEAAPVCLGKPSKRTAVQVSRLGASKHTHTHVGTQCCSRRQ
jgi:hypothetical protein